MPTKPPNPRCDDCKLRFSVCIKHMGVCGEPAWVACNFCMRWQCGKDACLAKICCDDVAGHLKMLQVLTAKDQTSKPLITKDQISKPVKKAAPTVRKPQANAFIIDGNGRICVNPLLQRAIQLLASQDVSILSTTSNSPTSEASCTALSASSTATTSEASSTSSTSSAPLTTANTLLAATSNSSGTAVWATQTNRWVVVTKKVNRNALVAFSRIERWDLGRVTALLTRLQSTDTTHHDIPILQHVQEHAQADGSLTVDFKFGKGATFGRVFSCGVGYQS